MKRTRIFFAALLAVLCLPPLLLPVVAYQDIQVIRRRRPMYPAGTTLRFYLPSSGAADVSPTFGGGTGTAWNDTTQGDRLKCVTTRINSGTGRKIYATIAGAAAQFVLARQYVSAPLQGGTLSGTAKGQISCGRGAGVGTPATKIFVVSGDGATVRGVALDLTASQLATAPPRFTGNSTTSNRRMLNASDVASMPLTDVAVQPGDRVVVEVGARELVDGAQNNTMDFRDNNGSDLPEDDTETGALNTWVEFSSCPPLQ